MSELRELNPLLDPNILTVNDLARLLRCSPDTVYRIPDCQLPVYRVGKPNLYLRDDVIPYLRLHCRVRPRPGIDQIITELNADMLDSRLDGVRERSRRRTK